MKTLERWSQAAEEFGVSESDLKEMSFQEGIIDEDGNVKKYAIENGIQILIHQGQVTITAEPRRKILMNTEFDNFKNNASINRGCCIRIKIVAITSKGNKTKAAVFTSVAF